MNYTTKSFKKQEISVHTGINCAPYFRCNNPKKCKTCHDIWRKKHYSKTTSHLKEDALKKFAHKKYITIKSKSLSHDFELKNVDVDSFIEDFKIMKRNKNFVIENNSQFIITKEISHTSELSYNPHYNIILLSHKSIDLNNKQLQKLLHKYNIEIYIDDIYKDKYDNTYLTSIKKLVNYSLKFEAKRNTLEKQINITKYKRDIYTTEFFNSDKYKELQRSLYIQIKDIKSHYKQKNLEAKRVFKRNTYNTSSKNYIRMLKSLIKKNKKYKSAERHYTRLAKCNFRANFW